MANIELRRRNGMPAHTTMLEAEDVTGDVVGGVSLFAKRDEVEKDCVVDDHFLALCTLAVLDWPPLAIPPTLGVGYDILNTHDLTDVSFQVHGDAIRAHRLVLAARSPVFKAELFGGMVESRDQSCITIEDMRARTFNLMLDYIYKNALPATPAPADASAILELQHLFVAADRYDLDKLRHVCEEIMCASITKETVLSILEFAEEHMCSPTKLKSRCLDFLDVAENFKEVGATDEYFCLMNNYPSLKSQVRNRFKRARLV